MADHLSPYNYLFNLILTRTGLHLDDHRRGDVMRVVEDMLATLHMTGVHSLSLALTLSPITHPLWQQLIQTVAVGETYFFRNQAQFNALRDSILPRLIAQRRQAGNLQLRIWSAGCATGEEPYSIAMLLRGLLPDISLWNVTLLATDLSMTNLEYARRGVYRPWSFRSETPSEVQKRWFTHKPEGYELDRSIRDMVTFAPLNLVTDDYPSAESGTQAMDVIVCRNVTIYFDQATTRRVVERFGRALLPDGWLVVGHAEPAASTYHDQGFTPRNFPDTVIYQKSGDPTPDTESAAWPLWTPILPAIPAVPMPEISMQSEPPPSRSEPPASPPPPPVEVREAAPAESGENAWEQARRAADQGRQHEALVWLAKVEAEDNLQPQVHYLRALIQLQMDDPVGALASLRQAVYCDPSFALAHYTLGTLYQQRGEYRMAARHWRVAQRSIAGINLDQPLPFAEEITVEMLRGRLEHRLGELPAGTTGTTEAPRVAI